MKKPIIGITIGDPSGIGPEVVVKALLSPDIPKDAEFVVIGDKDVISIYTNSFPYNILDLKNVDKKNLVLGRPSENTGNASFEYIIEAFRLIKEKKIDAIVTGPVSKSAICKAGKKFIGHTELFGNLTRKRAGMMFIAKDLRVSLVTIHIPLSKVSRMITKKRVYQVINLSAQSLIKNFKIKEPRICVLSLNPHRGEEKIIGKEEEIIAKAIEEANKCGINTEGPYPSDSAFLKKFDCFIAMYHDQGLIPIKLLAFDAVNFTMGLPFIRTSPCHGCAFDIAGKNKARPESMISAINLAYSLIYHNFS